MVEIRLFEPADLEGVLRLCVAEGWPSFPSDPDRARRVLTELFSDGELQAYLANVAVDADRRGEGIGRRLVTEALRRAGGERIDLLSEDSSTDFYRAFPNFEKPGFRLYPFYQADSSRGN